MKNIGKNCMKLKENPVWHFDLPLIMMNTGLREVSMVMYRRPRLKKKSPPWDIFLGAIKELENRRMPESYTETIT